MELFPVGLTLLSLVLLDILPPVGSTSIPEPCPYGCRCVSTPGTHARHRWHRLLAAYRMQKLVYGHQRVKVSLPMHYVKHHRRPAAPAASGGKQSDEPWGVPPSGREMTCMGLSKMPDYIPPGK